MKKWAIATNVYNGSLSMASIMQQDIGVCNEVCLANLVKSLGTEMVLDKMTSALASDPESGTVMYTVTMVGYVEKGKGEVIDSTSERKKEPGNPYGVVNKLLGEKS